MSRAVTRCLVLASLTVATLGHAAGPLGTATANRVALVTRTYPYTEDTWGRWLKPRLRYLARQCVQLASRELPASEDDKAKALLAQGMAAEEVAWVTANASEELAVPEGYQTPEELTRVCELVATHKLHPGCRPTLVGARSPYSVGLECALVTVGALDTGVQTWGVQSLQVPPREWFLSKLPKSGKVVLVKGAKAHLQLTVPQVEGSDWVDTPQPQPTAVAAQLQRPVRGKPGAPSVQVSKPEVPVVQSNAKPDAEPAVVKPVEAPMPPAILPLPALPPLSPPGVPSTAGGAAKQALKAEPVTTTVSRPPASKAKGGEPVTPAP